MLRKVLPFLLLVGAAFGAEQSTRHVTFHYGFTVKEVPPGQKIRIWFPAAHADDFQEVKVISANGDLPLKRNRESRFGNEIYYAESSKAEKTELHFEVVYDVVRHERVVLGALRPHLADLKLDPKEAKRDLAADKLVPVTGPVADLAAKITSDKTKPLEKAWEIYDDVLTTVSFDQSGSGPGHGDALYALNVKKGDCTEFHSLFIAMARSQGIPARFEIGFPLRSPGEIAEYQCRAEFFEADHGWVPVDIVEGLKNPVKRAFFFGALDAGRVEFSTGRDLVLKPAQAGAPLNYFVYPYVEVGGKEFGKVSVEISFAEVGQ